MKSLVFWIMAAMAIQFFAACKNSNSGNGVEVDNDTIEVVDTCDSLQTVEDSLQ